MNKLRTEMRYRIADRASRAILADGYETRPGWCQRWVKQVLLSLNISSEMAVEGSSSARVAFERYEKLGMVMPIGTKANIGDILYKVEKGNGKFGHVGIYVGKGLVAENSSIHWNGTKPDARGVRDISEFAGFRIVRLWEAPTK